MLALGYGLAILVLALLRWHETGVPALPPWPTLAAMGAFFFLFGLVLGATSWSVEARSRKKAK